MENFNFDEKTYRRKIKKRAEVSVFLLIILISILLIICGFLLKNKSNYISFYLVEADKVETYSIANEISTKVKQVGGGGYIYLENGLYHIFISCYTSKKEAQKVVEKIKNNFKNADIFECNLDTKYNSKCSNILKLNMENIKNLCEKAVFLDKNETNFEKTKIFFENIYQNFKTELSKIKFNTLNPNECYQKYYFEELLNDYKSLKNLNTLNFSLQIRYFTFDLIANQLLLISYL